MRKLVLALLIVAALMMFVAPVFAQGTGHDHCASGRDFGQHVAWMAQMGMIGADGHVPGMHQGYSHCLNVP